MSDRAAPAGWTELAGELDRWEDAGRMATLWWRDDDAASPSAALDRLLSLARGIPTTLAVIPAAADAALSSALGRWTEIAVVQHGWRHANHAAGGKKSEFPSERYVDAAAADLVDGRRRLAELFGDRALAVLAPPWNRLDERLVPLLPACGIGGLSRVRARRTAWPAPDVFEANVHVDLVAWTGGRGFVGEEAALGGLIEHLRARRLGEADPEEPTGILTHHLVQDRAADAFLRRLVELADAHPAARWLAGREVFALALGAP
jgi:hypothetical protein